MRTRVRDIEGFPEPGVTFKDITPLLADHVAFAGAIDAISVAPEKLAAAVNGLDNAQLDTPYRPGGWTVRQLVHHVADSHMNAYLRFRPEGVAGVPPANRAGAGRADGPQGYAPEPQSGGAQW